MTQVILIPVGMVSGIVLARSLGPSSKGIYYFTLLVPQMISNFSSLGISSASIYLLGKKKYGIQEIFGNQLVLAAALGILGLLVFRIILCFNIPSFKDIPHNLLLLSLILVPFFILNAYLYSDLLAQNLVIHYNLTRLLESSISVISFLILWFTKRLNLTSAVIISGSATITTSIILFITLYRRFKPFININHKYLKETIGFGIRSYINNLVGSLNYRIDVFIIGAILAASDLGQYSVAVNIGELLWLFSDSITLVLFPEFTKLSQARAGESAMRTCRNFLFISLLAGLGLFLGAYFFIPVLYGEVFRPSIVLLLLILPGIWIFSIVKIFNAYWAGNGKPEVNLIPLSIAAFTNIPLNLILLPIIGIKGASLSSTISYTLAAAFHIYFFTRSTRSKFTDILVIRGEDIAGIKQLLIQMTRQALSYIQ
jgi:O-antigen/teichoic acid export membrane protein